MNACRHDENSKLPLSDERGKDRLTINQYPSTVMTSSHDAIQFCNFELERNSLICPGPYVNAGFGGCLMAWRSGVSAELDGLN